jgi:ent-copalyl diphosphate synthase
MVNKKVGLVNSIKSILSSLEDGETNISAYDTAWVALVEDVEVRGTPQFPSSLEWIVKNQLQDGSWGDSQLFLTHDRILSTLACVIALRTWNMHPEKCDKGNIYINLVIKILNCYHLSCYQDFKLLSSILCRIKVTQFS